MNKKETTHPTIVEAVETLSSIADMEIDHDIVVADMHDVTLQDTSITYRTVHWLQQHDAEATVKMVKEVFRVILNYLRDFYQKNYRQLSNPTTIEGIKDIMVLVGEAAKKLDKYKAASRENKKVISVTQLKEYKQLQEFYLTRIARKVDESVLSQWISALSKQLLAQQQEISKRVLEAGKGAAKHVFIDLDSVKKDTEYELFFIRKEDGTRFFNPRIIRNIKLVCDFGDYFESRAVDDPLESISFWQIQFLQHTAKSILVSVNSSMNNYYQELKKIGAPAELDRLIHKALFALMLASNPHNLPHELNLKNSGDYFTDFLYFLREVLHTRDYQKCVAYHPSKKNTYAQSLLNLIHSLSYGLYAHQDGFQHLKSSILGLLQEANQEFSPEHREAWTSTQLLSDHLSSDYAAMSKFMKKHANGPLIKLLKVLEEGSYQAFDPLFQENIPSPLFDFQLNNKRMTVLRMPSPFYQEFVHKPIIIEEFKSFLLASSNMNGGHLLFNLQDRTSWKEHARCVALEELQKNPEFFHKLTVVTLPKDSEFFHQQAPYHDDNHAHAFIKHLKEQLQDERCGFFFPEEIKHELFPKFVNHTIDLIHRVFFGGKNVLLRANRLDFIEIFYLFLELKIIELVNPNTLSFTCKDGVDTGIAAAAELMIFLNWLGNEKLSDQEMEHLNLILYAPPIMIRERNMLPDRFNRMLSMIRTFELVSGEHGRQELYDILRTDVAQAF